MTSKKTQTWYMSFGNLSWTQDFKMNLKKILGGFDF